MATIKLQIEEFEETEYYVIAIHTSLEDYRLAYFINKVLNINLEKSNNDVTIQVMKDESQFSKFMYENIENDVVWSLVQNKNEIELTNTSTLNNLFSENYSKIVSKIYLLPEFKKVDFLLKIENIQQTEFDTEIISKLKEIDKISLAYHLDKEKIKSKNNLIF